MNSAPRHRRHLLRSPLVAGALLALALPFAAAASQNTATVTSSVAAGAVQNQGSASASWGFPGLPPLPSLTPLPPQIVLPDFRITIRGGLMTVAPQGGGVRGALHTAVVEINNDKGDRIQISRQSTANYLKRNDEPLRAFFSTLSGGAVRSFEVRATGRVDMVRTLTLHTDPFYNRVVTVTQGSDYKAFNLVAGDGGSLGISLKLYNYDSIAYTLDITPRKLTVTHALPGATIHIPVQISAVMPNIAGKKNTVLLMEARYAAFGFHFHQPGSGSYEWSDSRQRWVAFPVRMTNFIRYGAETPEHALRRMAAAATPGDTHHYIIPPHAAKGYYENQTSSQAGRFLSNNDVGTLAVDFRNALAHLHLKVHSFANTISGGSLLTHVGHLGDEFIAFDRFVLGGWGTLTAGIGNDGGYRAAISVSPLDANVRFYGERAQEIAGYFRYSSGGHMVRIGFIGIHPNGGVAAPPRQAASAAASYAALSWDSADGGGANMTVHTDASGTPVSLSVGGSVVAFGTAVSGRVYRYFRSTLGVALRPRTVGMVIGGQATLVMSVHSVTIASGAQSSVYAVQGKAYQSANSAVFSYIVGGEDATLFFISDDKDLRKARYGFFGAQTSPWVMDVLQQGSLHGDYTIPVGGAQGLAWNGNEADDYFLHNKAAGKLGVDFGGGVVALDITVDAIDKDDAYTDDFLKITDFRMKIRGNVFNNYHCTGATGIAGTACEGKLAFAGAYLTTYDAGSASVPAGSVRVQAGGAFYGANTPRALAGGIAYYVGESSRKGMRLQFLGAGGLRNTASGGGSPPDSRTVQAEESAGSPPPPAPHITLSAFHPSIRGTLMTVAPQEARVHGAVHTAVVQINNENGGNIVIARQSTADYLNINGVSLGAFTATLGGGTVQPLTLRGTGSIAAVRTLTYQIHPDIGKVPRVIRHRGSEKVFNLIAGGNGSLSILLHIYKSPGENYTLDITPGRVTLQHVLSDATVYEPVQISAVLPDIAGTKDTALLMEARYAAFGLNFGYDSDTSAKPRLTNFFRYGAETSASALQRMIAAAGGTYTYRIPRHAAKGYYENQPAPQSGRFLSNQDPGVLAVDFRSALARLHLTMHSFANTVIGNVWYLTDYNRLGSVFIAFNGFALGSWGTVTAGIGSGGYRSTAVGINAISANVRFYGERAQEVAGFIKYISDAAVVRIGFLGINEKGGVAAPLPASPVAAASYAALSWDSAGGSSSMTVHADASGAPVSLLIGETAVAFGSATSDYVHRYFRGTLGVALRPSDAGMITGENAGLTVSVHDVTVARGTLAVDMKSYRSADSASFSYVVSGEGAAYFYIMDDQDIRKARAGFYGVQTPLWVASVLQGASFRGDYTIPAGGAQGFAWNSDEPKDYFLHNKAAGALEVDFGKMQATLGITLDAADKDGAYTDGFLEIADFQMAIRGNVFNNYHCTGATHTAGTACDGTLTFASDYLATYNGKSISVSAGSVRVHAGGAFYGEGAPNAVAGGIAYYAGNDGSKGMRLQFLGVASVLPDIVSRVASTVNMATKADGSVVSTAGLSAFVSAEHAAFAARGKGSTLRMVHYGARTAPAILSTMANAVYRIAKGKASGTYTNANTAVLTLRNETAGQLQVNFQKNQATLDLTLQNSEAHNYELQDIGLLIESNGFRFCTECGGSINVSGHYLSVFRESANFQLNGAFYGAAAEQAAGVLRHTSSSGDSILNLGFIGEKE